MALQQKTYTSEEFWAFVNRPENKDRFFELRHGEIIEVSPSNTYSSVIAIEIAIAIRPFAKAHNLGLVSGEGGGYILSDDVTYVPDLAFVSRERQEIPPEDGFNPIVPDLVVEVVSPNNSAGEMHEKVMNYLAAGVRIVWVVYPKTKTVEVHTTEGARTLKITDTLDGGDVLPAFTLPVRDIFPK